MRGELPNIARNMRKRTRTVNRKEERNLLSMIFVRLNPTSVPSQPRPSCPPPATQIGSEVRAIAADDKRQCRAGCNLSAANPLSPPTPIRQPFIRGAAGMSKTAHTDNAHTADKTGGLAAYRASILDEFADGGDDERVGALPIIIQRWVHINVHPLLSHAHRGEIEIHTPSHVRQRVAMPREKHGHKEHACYRVIPSNKAQQSTPPMP